MFDTSDQLASDVDGLTGFLHYFIAKSSISWCCTDSSHVPINSCLQPFEGNVTRHGGALRLYFRAPPSRQRIHMIMSTTQNPLIILNADRQFCQIFVLSSNGGEDGVAWACCCIVWMIFKLEVHSHLHNIPIFLPAPLLLYSSQHSESEMEATFTSTSSYLFGGALLALVALVTYDRLPVILKELTSRADEAKVGNS